MELSPIKEAKGKVESLASPSALTGFAVFYRNPHTQSWVQVYSNVGQICGLLPCNFFNDRAVALRIASEQARGAELKLVSIEFEV